MKRHHKYDLPGPSDRKRTLTERNVFQIFPLHQFEEKCPYFRQPAEVGRFSLDDKRKFHDDNRQLRFLRSDSNLSIHKALSDREKQKCPVQIKDPNFDLKVGYSSYVCKNEEVQERLNHLLEWITLHQDKFCLKANENCNLQITKSLNTDFISWRGHFTKFLCTPYEEREPWQMAASLFRGAIFISEVETEYKRQQEQSRSQRQKEMCYWGYKFEDYMTTANCNGSIDPDDNKARSVVNSNEAYCTVVRTRMDHHSLVVGAEIDCRTAEDKQAPQNYIELKTSREISTERQNRNFARFKLLKFWAQSFLAGVPRVVCGFRDDDGIVHEIKSYSTLEVPNLADEARGNWKPSVCMNFCNKFLKWMKEIVTKEDPNTVYMFYFREPFEYINYTVTTDGSERFLPQWFTGDG